MSQTSSLATLLCDLFTTSELSRWLAGRDGTARLLPTVDFRGPPIEVAFNVAVALERHGLVDAAFFADLAQERPARNVDILAEAGRWSVRLQVSNATPAPAPAPAPNTPPRRGPVRVLHLSDLHAHKKTEWDARPLLTRLVDAVAELGQAGLPPDVVAITGDLAYGGQRDEYKLVEPWLKDELLPAAGLGADALLVVPGNHDVDRGACSSTMVASLEQALRGGDQDRLAQVLGDKDQKKVIHQRYKEYLASLKRLGVAHAIAPSWSLRRTIRGVSVRFAGLDTAWLHSVDEAQGRLALGLAALNAALPARRDADVVVALAHHPVSWLVDRDQAAVAPPLRTRADVLLRGHLHDPDYVLSQSPHHHFVELPAGACYAGHKWPMSFQLVELDPDANQGRVHNRTWRQERDAWVADRNLLPPDGIWTFRLR